MQYMTPAEQVKAVETRKLETLRKEAQRQARAIADGVFKGARSQRREELANCVFRTGRYLTDSGESLYVVETTNAGPAMRGRLMADLAEAGWENVIVMDSSNFAHAQADGGH